MSEIKELKAYIELDTEIKNKVETAYKLKNDTKLKIAKQKKELETTMWDDNKRKIEAEKINLDESIKQQKIESETALIEKKLALQKQFDTNSAQWIDQIVKRCLGE